MGGFQCSRVEVLVFQQCEVFRGWWVSVFKNINFVGLGFVASGIYFNAVVCIVYTKVSSFCFGHLSGFKQLFRYIRALLIQSLLYA